MRPAGERSFAKTFLSFSTTSSDIEPLPIKNHLIIKFVELNRVKNIGLFQMIITPLPPLHFPDVVTNKLQKLGLGEKQIVPNPP